MLALCALLLTAAPPEPERVAGARLAHEASLVERAAALGLAWPPRELYLRAFKHERVLEVWAGDGAGRPLVLFEEHPICGESGSIGPKVERGDLQIPEGLYLVTRLHPDSQGWLSLRMSYPNAADRARAAARAKEERRRVSPGGDILVHGTCISIGCIAIDNAPIERVYLLAQEPVARGRAVRVDVFPGRMEPERLDALLEQATDVGTVRLWRSLVPAYFAFERTRRVPSGWPRGDGTYGVAARRAR
ncbi:MAG: hypothetical protein IT383_27660 [Deltaproteobacteria bacterium]|nr:hypothetical protein [Deltaproteobacteria bacterium]